MGYYGQVESGSNREMRVAKSGRFPSRETQCAQLTMPLRGTDWEWLTCPDNSIRPPITHLLDIGIT